MFVDSESEVARVGEVLLKEFIFLHFEAALEDLKRLLSPNRDVTGDFLITADSEGSEGVTRLGVHRLLAGELLEHTGGTGEAIS